MDYAQIVEDLQAVRHGFIMTSWTRKPRAVMSAVLRPAA